MVCLSPPETRKDLGSLRTNRHISIGSWLWAVSIRRCRGRPTDGAGMRGESLWAGPADKGWGRGVPTLIIPHYPQKAVYRLQTSWADL